MSSGIPYKNDAILAPNKVVKPNTFKEIPNIATDTWFTLFNSREAMVAVFGDMMVVLQFKEFELYWGAVFLRSVHKFS